MSLAHVMKVHMNTYINKKVYTYILKEAWGQQGKFQNCEISLSGIHCLLCRLTGARRDSDMHRTAHKSVKALNVSHLNSSHVILSFLHSAHTKLSAGSVEQMQHNA